MWLRMYIHLNPIEVVCPLWKKNSVVDFERVIKKLNSYSWVSCSNYSRYKDNMEEKLSILEKKIEWD